MVNEAMQLEGILKSLSETKEKPELKDYLSGMSYMVKNLEDGKRKIYPYFENRLDIVKDIFRLEIQQCHQKFSGKKIKRPRMKMAEGNLVCVRVYDKDNQDLQDFRYKKIKRIWRQWNGWMIEFAEGECISGLKFRLFCDGIFKKYKDWSVYEDLNFRESDIKLLEDIEEKYISRWKNRMWCISCNKAKNRSDKEEILNVSSVYIEQRKKVYTVLKKSRFFRDEDKKILDVCMDKYLKERISVKELYQCFDLEYQVLTRMEERIE